MSIKIRLPTFIARQTKPIFSFDGCIFVLRVCPRGHGHENPCAGSIGPRTEHNNGTTTIRSRRPLRSAGAKPKRTRTRHEDTQCRRRRQRPTASRTTISFPTNGRRPPKTNSSGFVRSEPRGRTVTSLPQFGLYVNARQPCKLYQRRVERSVGNYLENCIQIHFS